VSKSPRVGARRVAVAWLLVAAYGALITALSSLGKPPIPEGLQTTPGTLVLHAFEFAGLSLLLSRALARSRPAWSVSKVVLITIAATAAFGILDEIHQHFVPGRYCQVIDVVADTIGGSLAALLSAVVGRRRGAWR